MNSRTPLLLSLSIAAALSAPMAFAQDANARVDGQQAASAQAAPQPAPQAAEATATQATATQATATTDTMGAQPATQAAPQAAPEPAAASRKVTWSDLDGDKDGTLTKTEAAPIESLSKVFDKADADGDGSLTAEEYKQYLASSGNAGGQHGS